MLSERHQYVSWVTERDDPELTAKFPQIIGAGNE